MDQVPLSYFLKEREVRYSIEQANELRLGRLEKIDFSGEVHVANPLETHTAMILVKSGDLVVSGINVKKGAISVYEGNEDLLATIHYSSYSIDKSRIDADYLKLFIKSSIFKQAVSAKTKGGIKTELKPKDFLSITVPYTELPEQIRIRTKVEPARTNVDLLGGVMEQNTKQIGFLRQAILRKAFLGSLVSQDSRDEPASELLTRIRRMRNGDSQSGVEASDQTTIREGSYKELPAGWVRVPLLELVSMQGGGTPSKSREEFWKDGRNPWITPKDMKREVITDSIDHITDDAVRSSRLKPIPRDSVLIVVRGMILARTIPLAINGDEVTVNQDMKALIPYQREMGRYLLHFLQSQIPELLRKTRTSTHGTKRLETSTIEALMVPLPPLREQSRIVERTEQLMNLCTELEAKLRENQGKMSLLREAVLAEVLVNPLDLH